MTSHIRGNEQVESENIEAVIRVLINTGPWGRKIVFRTLSRNSIGIFSYKQI